MNRRLIFMKARLEKDLEELECEQSQNQHLIERRLLGVEIGNQCAFVSIHLLVRCGPFEGCRLNVIIKINPDFPFSPPLVFCHDKGFFHPNKDIITNQILFSLVDPKFWKPTFELSQVLCGLELVLLEPEPSYSSIRSTEIYRNALQQGLFQKVLAGGMDLEGSKHDENLIIENLRRNTTLPSQCREPSIDTSLRTSVKVKYAH